MTDDELNEIFRAIRHRRTLSWATIEKLANEVREARKTKATKPATFRFGPKTIKGEPIEETMKRYMFLQSDQMATEMIRQQSAFHKIAADDLADSPKKE